MPNESLLYRSLPDTNKHLPIFWFLTYVCVIKRGWFKHYVIATLQKMYRSINNYKCHNKFRKQVWLMTLLLEPKNKFGRMNLSAKKCAFLRLLHKSLDVEKIAQYEVRHIYAFIGSDSKLKTP
jgi:hypothetical protein